MKITAAQLQALTTGFNLSFTRGFEGGSTFYDKIAMMTKSSGREEVYAWLSELPEIREWLGERRINSLRKEGFSIENRRFESTVRVQRTHIEDDTLGIYGPLFEDLGRRSQEFPDKLMAELIQAGFTTECYDGQNFFDEEHVVTNGGKEYSVSNMQDGAEPTWYLLDLTRAVRPFIYQERIPFEMQSVDDDYQNVNVFLKDEYLYGVRGRCNVGFGLWQMAFASKAELNPTNYEAARTAMSKLRGDENRLLGIRPTTLLVPVELEGRGRKILLNTLGEAGESNSWAESAELMVSPWLDNPEN